MITTLFQPARKNPSLQLSTFDNSGIPDSIREQAVSPPSLGFYPFTIPDSDNELGTNCCDFTVCDDDEVIKRIDPPVSVSSYHVTAELETNRPHIKQDDSDSSLAGTKQVTISQLMSLESVKWAPGIVDLQLENPSNIRTTVSQLLFLSKTLF